MQLLAGILGFITCTRVKKLESLKETFKFPPTVSLILFDFQCIVADINLYPKSLNSAQTVEF